MRFLPGRNVTLARALALSTLAVTQACDSGRLTEPRAAAKTPDGPSLAAAPLIGKVGLIVDAGIDRKTWTVKVGTDVKFGALAYDRAGKPIPASAGVQVKFKSTKPAIFKIDSITGAGVALAPGHFQVSASAGGISTLAGFTAVVAPTTTTTPSGTTATPTPAPTPTLPTSESTTTSKPTTPGTPAAPATPEKPGTMPAGAIPLSVVRFDGKTGAATVSNGVPLKAGALMPGQEGNVRVYVGGVEQAAYVTGLHSRHPDGSLRAVLVQFAVSSLGATPLDGGLAIGSARPTQKTLSTPLATPGAAISGVPLGLPQAAALPTDPTYLIATDLVGPTTTTVANTALGGAFAKYEKDFVTNADRLWSIDGANSTMANYYDRVLIYYAFWARTGNATYWARAGQIAHDYRTRYLEFYNYGASPHSAQLEGLEKHYLLTGAEASRLAVVKTGAVMWSAYLPTKYMTSVVGESRIAARVLHSQLLAWRLTPPGAPAISGTAGKIDWSAAIETALTKIEAWQAPDGSYPATIVCGGQLNYMVGMLNDALIKTYDYYVPTTTNRTTMQGTIRTLVAKAVDYLWKTQWRTDGSFNYASVACSGVGGPGPAPDLNNMISASFGWAARQTGDSRLAVAGDQIFAAGVAKAYLTGAKQFNENYTSSFRFLAYR